MDIALSVQGLSKKYTSVLAANNVSFDIQKGEIFALIGPNGAGKTTTIRMISTLIQPTSGDAFVDGISVVNKPSEVRKKITYLPDEAGAYKNMKGIKYLEFMASLFANNDLDAKQYVENAVSMSALGDKLNEKIGTYSRGMIRKLLLSRAVMTRPTLAILDEPTSGLDILNALEIRRMIRKLADEGMSFLISSHNMLEIEYLSDRVGIINKGVLSMVGKPEDLKKEAGASNLEEVFERCALTSEEEQ